MLCFNNIYFLVFGAGFWFETHMFTYSNWANHDLFVNALTDATARRKVMIDEKVSATLIEKEMGNFWVMTLFHLYHMGNKTKLQQFAFTMFLDSRGLSDSGRDVLSKLDICMSHGAFLSYRDECLRGAEEEQRSRLNLHNLCFHMCQYVISFRVGGMCDMTACNVGKVAKMFT